MISFPPLSARGGGDHIFRVNMPPSFLQRFQVGRRVSFVVLLLAIREPRVFQLSAMLQVTSGASQYRCPALMPLAKVGRESVTDSATEKGLLCALAISSL
jgi:hypothetical protein